MQHYAESFNSGVKGLISCLPADKYMEYGTAREAKEITYHISIPQPIKGLITRDFRLRQGGR
jgi:hypothetical protein